MNLSLKLGAKQTPRDIVGFEERLISDRGQDTPLATEMTHEAAASRNGRFEFLRGRIPIKAAHIFGWQVPHKASRIGYRPEPGALQVGQVRAIYEIKCIEILGMVASLPRQHLDEHSRAETGVLAHGRPAKAAK